MHIGQREKGFTIFDLFGEVMRDRILSIEYRDAKSARYLAEQYPFLSPRDLIHLPVMMRHGLTTITTADAGFDRINIVKRIDPSQFPDFQS
jgi:predicted nucleic acid-binding protein